MLEEKICLVLLSLDEILSSLPDVKSNRYCYYNLESRLVGVASFGSSHNALHISFGGCENEADVRREIRSQLLYISERLDISYFK